MSKNKEKSQADRNRKAIIAIILLIVAGLILLMFWNYNRKFVEQEEKIKAAISELEKIEKQLIDIENAMKDGSYTGNLTDSEVRDMMYDIKSNINTLKFFLKTPQEQALEVKKIEKIAKNNRETISKDSKDSCGHLDDMITKLKNRYFDWKKKSSVFSDSLRKFELVENPTSYQERRQVILEGRKAESILTLANIEDSLDVYEDKKKKAKCGN